MDCTTIRTRLNALCDGERLPGAGDYLRVALHYARCGRCRAAASVLRRNRRAARTLPAPPPPEALKDRVLACLPALEETAMIDAPVSVHPLARLEPRAAPPLPARLARATALAVVLAAASLLFMPRTDLDAPMAAEIRRALQDTNTWHLRGWKEIEGERVPWEVWGRRTPYFYRVQVGEQVRVDDGTQRFEVLPALDGGPRQVLRTRSRPALDDWTIHPGMLFEGFQGLGQKPWKETPETAVFRHDVSPGQAHLFTIDKRTRLPIRYDAQNPNPFGDPTAEYLDLQYGAPLPASATDLRWPGFEVIDALSAPPAGALPQENTARSGGLTGQLLPIARDTQGNVLVQVRAWLGTLPVRTNSLFMMNVSAPHSWRARAKDAPSPFHDDANRPYAEVVLESLRSLQHVALNGEPMLLFSPLRPLRKGESLPRTLTVSLSIGMQMLTPPSTPRGFDTVSLDEELTWTVRLPDEAVPAPVDLDRYLPAGWLQKVPTTGDPESSLPATIAASRGLHLMEGFDVDHLTSDADVSGAVRVNDRVWRKKLTLANHWLEESVRRVNPRSAHDRGQSIKWRLILAANYRRLGDEVRAARVLREAVAESRKEPVPWNINGLRGSLERALRAVSGR